MAHQGGLTALYTVEYESLPAMINDELSAYYSASKINISSVVHNLGAGLLPRADHGLYRLKALK